MRGSMVSAPAGPASCACSSTSSSTRSRVVAGAARGSQQHQPVVAAAVLDAPRSTASPHHGSNTPGGVTLSPNHQQQQATGAAGGSSAGPPAAAAAAAVIAGAVGAEVLHLNNGRTVQQKLRRRARDRSPRPHSRMHHYLQRQFNTILEDYQVGYEAWLHAQEEQLLRLQAANAPSSALHYHATQHDRLKRAWEQKWGPPAARGNKLSLLPQARAAVLALSSAQPGAAPRPGHQAPAAAVAGPAHQQQAASSAQQMQPQAQTVLQQQEQLQQHEPELLDMLPGSDLKQGLMQEVQAAPAQALQNAEQVQLQEQAELLHAQSPQQQQHLGHQQQLQQQQHLGHQQQQQQLQQQVLAAFQEQQPAEQQQQEQPVVAAPQLQPAELPRQKQKEHKPSAAAAAQRQASSASNKQQQQPSRNVKGGPRHNSSSSSNGGIRRVRSSALDIPDDTPEQVAAAAAATAAAGQKGSFSSQSAHAAAIVTAICQDPIDREVLDGIEIVFLNLTLQKLLHYHLADKLPVLAEYILSRPDVNEHSYGAVFDAYACANQLELALATWDSLAGRGVDIGPIGSSALMKACARQMDLGTAKQVFEQLLRRRVTFNSYTYHCLMQLCGSAGSLEDALAVYNLQRLETQPGNLPNSRTYLALVRAMLVAGRCELAQQIFENMLEDDVAPHPALYCSFLTAAGRAGNLGFARYLYQHMAVSLELPQPLPVQMHGLLPASDPHADLLLPEEQLQYGISSSSGDAAAALPTGLSTSSSSSEDSNSEAVGVLVAAQQAAGFLDAGGVTGGGVSALEESSGREGDEPDLLCLVNALLSAHAQVGALSGAVAIYRQELLGRGLVPDGYTCTALLTAAARLGSARLAWSQVAEVVELTHAYGITLSTQLGTALINAYRRVRCWQPPQQQQQQQQGQGQQGEGAAGAQAAGKRAGGRGRRKGGSRAQAANSEEGATADTTSQQQQQQQQQGLDAAWEQEQLRAIGAAALPGVSPVVCASLHAAQQVLGALQEHKLASSSSYVTMMCFLLEQGQVGAFRQLYTAATEQQGISICEQGWEKLAHAAAECGAGALVAGLQQQVQQAGLDAQQRQQEALTRERLRARQQQLGQGQQGLAAPVAR